MKNIVYCNIRVEEDAWEKLRAIAKSNKRSLNKEIEYLIDKRIEEHEKNLNKIAIEKTKNFHESIKN